LLEKINFYKKEILLDKKQYQELILFLMMKRLRGIKEFDEMREALKKRKNLSQLCIVVSSGTCGKASGADKLIYTIKKEIKKQKLEKKVEIRITGCLGFCQVEPIMIIYPKAIFYPSPHPKDVPEIIKKTIMDGKIIERLLYTDPLSGKRIAYEYEIPFYKKQERIILGNNSKIDPHKIEDYIQVDGYKAFTKVLSQYSPERVIEEIKKSGLRGRGGAGFPTGRKWEITRKQPVSPKYIICNADEGDPGAFMDRNILESTPHSVIEGMLIGGYAIGANESYIYVRAEYPLACKNLEIAINQAEEYGFLGDNILGTDFSFKIHIKKGAGAFVCGEESALIASIEGKPGEPTPRPPYPAEKGVWGKPTNINNVKTWASVPHIINKGADWFASIGTKKSKGTMIFSLVGKVNNTGLVEVPMGITLREMIYEIGGGIPGNKKLKAVQTGGPSGGCIPYELTTTPIDYEELAKLGSIMGSGGCVVMDEDTCMVDVAKYFLSFTKEESCGKCTPCREGNARLLDILTQICEGKGKEGDIEELKELSETIIDTSLCALGKTAPNPVLTTIRYFRDEYEAHIKEHKCPAKVCKELIVYSINPEICTGCMACAKVCPQKAIIGEKKKAHKIEQNKCIKCGVCQESCKFDAIIVK
jgi:NADH-quinone oxidoreductase subunit F